MNRIIEKIKIAGTIIVSLIITILFARYIFPQQEQTVPSNLAIKTVLAQTPNMSLTLKQIKVEVAGSVNYKLNLRENYYTFKLLDSNNKVLYQGRILNKYIIPPPDYFGSDPSKAPKWRETRVEIPNTLSLNLPYFKDTKRILFVDENGVVKLEVNVNNLPLPK